MKTILFFASLLIGSLSIATSLKDTSTQKLNTFVLPQTDLVNLGQKQGFDPFDFFEEGMAPENENRLMISNSKGKLEIDLGGSSFVHNSKDGSLLTKVQALEFSDAWQRYLIDLNYNGSLTYQILVNVDRTHKAAHVWMRKKIEGPWSDWKLTAIY